MIIRLTCYTDIFVNVTLTLDEATALIDAAEVSRSLLAPEVVLITDKFRNELEVVLGRALEIQRKKADG